MYFNILNTEDILHYIYIQIFIVCVVFRFIIWFAFIPIQGSINLET